MQSQRVHIVPHEQGWALKREGETKIESVHPTQAAAIDAGRDMARQDEVDLVVHRQDGTFRNVLTYTNDNENMSANNNPDRGHAERGNRKRLEPHDVFSVGSRVSWSAIVAGAAVALALNAILWMGGLAIGITVVDKVSGRMMTIWSAVWVLVSTLVSMFAGGLVVSRVTTGEDKTEAVLYGVILWGFIAVLSFALAGVAGAGMSTAAQLASLRPMTGGESYVNPDYYSQLKMSDEQIEKNEALREKAQSAAGNLSPTAAAWWAFATLVLSLGAAVGGSLLASGPEFTWASLRRPRTVTATPGGVQPA
jgi:hypothetical protein